MAAGLRVLLAEDDPLERLVVFGLLEELECAVVGAPDGRAAWEWLRAGRACDLLLTDVSMPDVGGLELLAATRQVLPNLPVVVMSGDPANSEPALHLGAWAFLAKPASAEQLAALLRELPLRRPGRPARSLPPPPHLAHRLRA